MARVSKALRLYSNSNTERSCGREVCEEKQETDLPCQSGSANKRKFHTSSARTSQTAQSQPKKKTIDSNLAEPNDGDCPPMPPKAKPQKMDFSRMNAPKLKMCPQPPGHVPKTKQQLAKEGCVDEEDKPKFDFLTQIATYVSVCNKKPPPPPKDPCDKTKEPEREEKKEEEEVVDCCLKRCNPHDLQRASCPCFARPPPPPPPPPTKLLCKIFHKLGIFCGCKKKKPCTKKCRWPFEENYKILRARALHSSILALKNSSNGIKNEDCKEEIPKKEEEECEEEVKVEIKEEVKKVEEKCPPPLRRRKGPHDIKRVSCYPCIPKKRSIFCRIFSMLGVACGKKRN
ncbi:hypothetical protein GE061_002935 [Apolygus lucorum]|uniref:Uncharacterized protein n=1 Tax=Apolygus lucorum TaxID=248454 RepID=A0A8S9X235_APOLU|nr:hypothetical protein GE061_002935 [Apolygus lucorum]